MKFHKEMSMPEEKEDEKRWIEENCKLKRTIKRN